MSKKPTLKAFLSPAGEAVFPWITRADTEYNAGGVFKTDLSVPFEEAQDFIATLEKARDDFIATLPVAKQKTLVPKPVYFEEYTRPEYPENATKEEKKAIRDAWEGEPTGNVVFRFKLNNNVKTQAGETFTQAPVVVDDATGEDIEGAVFGGSIIRIKGQIVPYTNAAAATVGVTLRMKSVFVIEQVGGDASAGDGDNFWRSKDVD
jgi:hypothetical protein